MRFPDLLLRSVFFLGTLKGEWTSTGFLLSVLLDPEEPSLGHQAYLVTAKHNALALAGSEFRVRFNTQSGGSVPLRSGPNFKWYNHPEDKFVDVAVCPFDEAPADIDGYLMNSTYHATDQWLADKWVGVGDEVYIVGLFTEMAGEVANMPIVRTGTVAAMPREKIWIDLNGKKGFADGYLIEMRSMGGLSGSPVFVSNTRSLELEDNEWLRAPSVMRLFGIMHGHWPIKTKDRRLRKLGTFFSEINMGIAVVVPIRKIVEVLDHPDLMKKRKEKADLQRHAPTLDTAQQPIPEKRKNRDIEISPIVRERFFDALNKATERSEKK